MTALRRWLLPVAVYLAASAAFTLPILRAFTTAIPHDAGDPVLNTWILWWNSERLPLTAAWWNAPMFFPMSGALALSETLLGLLPISGVVQWLTDSPLVAYNTAFVLSFPLCALAAYALALELTGDRPAALVAGLAFAFAPYRMGQLSHVQVLSYYGAPLALFAAHRFIRTGERWLLAVFSAAWLMLSLTNGYAMFHLAVLLAFWILWFARRTARAVPILAAWAIGSVPLVPVLWRYQEIHGALHLTRSINEIKGFGLDLADWLTAPPEVLVWGARLWPSRPETAVFPGLTLIVVAALSCVAGWRGRRRGAPPRTLDQKVLTWIAVVAALVAFSFVSFGPWRLGPLTVSEFRKPFSIAVAARVLAALRSAWVRRAWREESTVAFYIIAVIGLYVLALGPEPRIAGRPFLYQPPYAWLMELPGFATLRVPARFAMLAVLAQAVLLAFAAAYWRARVSPRVASGLVAVVAAGVLADGWVRLPVAPVQEAGPAWADVPAVFEVPAGGLEDFGAIYRATQHGRPIVNGYSGYFPPFYLPLLHALRAGEYQVLHELTPERPLGVGVNLRADGAAAMRAGLEAASGVVSRDASATWASFTVMPRPLPAQSEGPALAVAAVRANRHPEDIERLKDGTVGTAWGSDNNQIGDEELVVDLGGEQAIGIVRLKMGAFAFGFPRQLTVEVSSDANAWTTVWSGETSVAAVRGSIHDPATAPLDIPLGRVQGRFIRLRQTGAEPGIPWWIAELEIRAAAPEAMARRN